MTKTVVTGGAGFIGSNLSQELVKRGNNIVILDDLSIGKKGNIGDLIGESATGEVRRGEALLKKRSSPVQAEAKVQFIQGSVTDLPLLQQLFHNVDYVFHLAAIPSVRRSIENPLASHNTNMTGTLNVLLAARENKVRKVIYASSSSVYGDTPTLPKTEDMPPNPQSPYAVTKLAGEYYCQVYGRVYDLPWVCLRYFNVYGPRQDPNSQYAAVIPSFISRVLKDEPPIIFGDGAQSRDFTFVEDAVAASILAAESNITGVFNIGTGRRVTINALAQLISSIMGKGIEPIYQEPRPGDIKHSLADIRRAKAFGYNPRCSLEKGLEKTIKWFDYQNRMYSKSVQGSS